MMRSSPSDRGESAECNTAGAGERETNPGGEFVVGVEPVRDGGTAEDTLWKTGPSKLSAAARESEERG